MTETAMEAAMDIDRDKESAGKIVEEELELDEPDRDAEEEFVEEDDESTRIVSKRHGRVGRPPGSHRNNATKRARHGSGNSSVSPSRAIASQSSEVSEVGQPAWEELTAFLKTISKRIDDAWKDKCHELDARVADLQSQISRAECVLKEKKSAWKLESSRFQELWGRYKAFDLQVKDLRKISSKKTRSRR